MNTSQKVRERLINGIIKENPTFVLMLGMCPTLAVTTSAINGFGMGATTMVVLALSNLIISLLRHIIPKKVRIPAFIVIIASFVTVVQLLLQAYIPFLNDALGVYIPLIVVNCIILGRAESYAYSNPPVPSLFDGIGMGLGFTIALTIIGGFREILGTGKLFNTMIMPQSFTPIGIFVLAPGAFFVLAFLCAAQNVLKAKLTKAGKDASKIGSGCSEDCMNCPDKGCSKRFYDTTKEATKQNTEPKPSATPETAEEQAKAISVREEKVQEKVEVQAKAEAIEVQAKAEAIEEQPKAEPTEEQSEEAQAKESMQEEAIQETEMADDSSVKPNHEPEQNPEEEKKRSVMLQNVDDMEILDLTEEDDV